VSKRKISWLEKTLFRVYDLFTKSTSFKPTTRLSNKFLTDITIKNTTNLYDYTNLKDISETTGVNLTLPKETTLTNLNSTMTHLTDLNVNTTEFEELITTFYNHTVSNTINSSNFEDFVSTSTYLRNLDFSSSKNFTTLENSSTRDLSTSGSYTYELNFSNSTESYFDKFEIAVKKLQSSEPMGLSSELSMNPKEMNYSTRIYSTYLALTRQR